MLKLATLDIAGSEAVPDCIPASIKHLSSQQSIADTARKRLQCSAHPGIHHIQCQYDQGVLALRGRVVSYYHKQIAQEAVRNLRGVYRILNLVEVITVG